MRNALAVMVLCAAVAFGQANPELEKANRLFFDQKYPDAAKALEAAAKIGGNPRDVVMRIYELQGIVYGQLNQTTKSREAFQALLALDPKRELNGKQNSKVAAAFSAAQDWSNTTAQLEFKAAKPGVDDKGRIIQVAAKVKNDGMKLSRKVRFHLRTDDSKWIIQDSELQGVYAAATTDATGVEWWAELLGDNDRVLMLIASEGSPQREGKVKDRPVAAADAPKKDTAETKPPTSSTVEATSIGDDEKKPAPAVATRTASSSSGPLRPLGYALIGLGVVGLGVGTAFGVMSSSSRSRITGATKDSQDRVTSITQKEALALEPQIQSQALIANVMLGVGGGVALLGGVFWLVGSLTSSSEASVSIAPTLGGVVVSGSY